jgi:hypothetical protein
VSVFREDPQKVACAHKSLRASANASEKVGRGRTAPRGQLHPLVVVHINSWLRMQCSWLKKGHLAALVYSLV